MIESGLAECFSNDRASGQEIIRKCGSLEREMFAILDHFRKKHTLL